MTDTPDKAISEAAREAGAALLGMALRVICNELGLSRHEAAAKLDTVDREKAKRAAERFGREVQQAIDTATAPLTEEIATLKRQLAEAKKESPDAATRT